MRKLITLITLLALLMLASVPTFAQEDEETATIADVVVASTEAEEPQFTILLQALQTANLVDAVADPEADLTVFAPTDAAFEALLAELGATPEELLAREDLADILLYHVVEGSVSSEAIVEALNDANALYPETLSGARQNVTLDGENVMVDDATVITPDVGAANGVIHVIDTVLLPPPAIAGAVAQAAESDAAEFTTLLAAVTQAELVDALSDPEADLTVFAPTDEAFGALLEELGVTPEDLLAREDLADILLYHVVEGEFFSGDVVDGLAESDPLELTTLNGATISITANDDGVFINGEAAQVVDTDIVASNGVIHVINGVLLPPAAE